MASFADVLGNAGLKVQLKGTKTPQGKLLAQADSMLTKLDSDEYKNPKKKGTNPLDYSGSNQLWWSGSSTDGVRNVKMYYDNKVVKDGDDDLLIQADDTRESVFEVIGKLKALLEGNKLDDAINAEEERRKEKAANAKAKKS